MGMGTRWTAGLFTIALGGALALGGFSPAGAAPAKGGGGSTTTTTTKPGKSGSSAPFAKLAIKSASLGHVQVETAGSSTFQPGTDGEALHVGDTVQTDNVGLAEIDYAANTYTRLDVNTTFTIKKLTDNQGNRQVQGNLTSGQTWNRTVALTQSESFQQSGAGVNAAVAGTAFAVTCPSPTQCTFTGVVDNVILTGSNGQTETLNPLNQCVATSGGLCAAPSQLTPDQVALIQWIQQNVFLDFVEHGLGNGVFQPFSGTVQVNGAVVQSFTASTPNQGFTPIVLPQPNNVPNPPPASPTIDPNSTLGISAPSAPSVCNPDPTQCSGILVEDEHSPIAFTINATDPNTPQQLFYLLLSHLQGFSGVNAPGTLTALQPSQTTATPADTVTHYDPKTTFTFNPNSNNETSQPASFAVQAVNANNPSIASTPKTVKIATCENDVMTSCAPSTG